VLLDEPRVLICGTRHWNCPRTVTTVCHRLEVRYGDRLDLIEGAPSGADRAACSWCRSRGWDYPGTAASSSTGTPNASPARQLAAGGPRT
jgi:hypothetical protein